MNYNYSPQLLENLLNYGTPTSTNLYLNEQISPQELNWIDSPESNPCEYAKDITGMCLLEIICMCSAYCRCLGMICRCSVFDVLYLLCQIVSLFTYRYGII